MEKYNLHPLPLPQVNLNGSPGGRLVEQQVKVLNALYRLEEALAEASPHGRDYQTLPEGAYQQARDAWAERRMLAQDLRHEIEAHALKIQEQGK